MKAEQYRKMHMLGINNYKSYPYDPPDHELLPVGEEIKRYVTIELLSDLTGLNFEELKQRRLDNLSPRYVVFNGHIRYPYEYVQEFIDEELKYLDDSGN